MKGQNHARMGAMLVAAATTAGAMPWASEPAGSLVVTGLIVGGAVAPDLDHAAAAGTKSFGVLTEVVAGAIRGVSWAGVQATRLEGDTKRGGHRGPTHSAVGATAAGGLFAWLCSTSTAWGAVPAAVGCGLLAGMGVYAINGGGNARARNRPRWWPSRGEWKWLAALLVGLLVWSRPVLTAGWWPWWLGAALALGMVVHCAGDAMTRSGVPFLWLLTIRDGKRWGSVWLLPFPLRFTTGGIGERVAILVVGALVTAFCVAVLWAPTAVPSLAPGQVSTLVTGR